MIGNGRVLSVHAGVVHARIPGAQLGEGVRLGCARGKIHGHVSALRDGVAVICAHGAIDGLAAGDIARTDPAALAVPLGLSALGRAFDARGRALDGKTQPLIKKRMHVTAPPTQHRSAIREPFWTGVRAIDGLLTIGRGARIGIFGSPGTGKSTLLHAIMRGSYADAVVVGLIGERGREAEEWLRLAPEHATIVCATGDRCAAERSRSAHMAMAQACALRERGLDVLLILDSLARFAAAQRELALAQGETSGRGGFPPSVFAELAAFTEAAGACKRGSVTLCASVLSDGDERDPISEAARALLDGHLQLSHELASSGRFPSIDVLKSVSRTMSAVVTEGQRHDAAMFRSALAQLERTRDARAVGILPAGEDATRAIAAEAALELFLRHDGIADAERTIFELRRVAASLEEGPWKFQPV